MKNSISKAFAIYVNAEKYNNHAYLLPTPSKVRTNLPELTSHIEQVVSVEALAISLPSALALRAEDGFWCPDIECTNGPPGDVKHTELGNKQGRQGF